MKKQLLAIAAALGFAGFALANAQDPVEVDGRSQVYHWATAVICEGFEDGELVEWVCQGGHTGFYTVDWIDTTTNLVGGLPGVSTGIQFLSV